MAQLEAGLSLARVQRTLAAEARRLRASRDRLAAVRQSLVLPAADEPDVGDPATLLAGAIDCAVHEQLAQAIAALEDAAAETARAPGDRSRSATDGGRQPRPPTPGPRTGTEDRQPGGRP